MAPNDLHDPLQNRPAPKARAPRRPLVAPVLISAGLALAGVAALWLAVVDEPDGGQPVAIVQIEDAVPAATGSITPSGGEPAAAAAAPPPDAQIAALPAAPSAGGALPALLEQSAFGPLPRVSPDGRRPREAYARRPPAAGRAAPRVAIVVGGLGLSQTGTQQAIELLPEDVTLAFAPYGSSLQRWVDKARLEGHEVLLQLPLEPLGYPEENPGEHTLLVSADRVALQRDLHWNLARMTGYAGVMNYMGGRFTAEEQALAPLIGEIGERGLFFLDDGSSPASRAAAMGKAMQAPVVIADSIIDRDRATAAIELELEALEATARSRGYAVGVASAFPASVAAIAAWAKAAGDRGIVLAPVSANLQP